MNKYLKAFLIFIFWWIIVGTAISFFVVLLGIKGFEILGPIIGFSLGIYNGIRSIKK